MNGNELIQTYDRGNRHWFHQQHKILLTLYHTDPRFYSPSNKPSGNMGKEGNAFFTLSKQKNIISVTFNPSSSKSSQFRLV